MNILHDFITAAERVGSKAEPETATWPFVSTTGRDITERSFADAARASIAWLGPRYCCHRANSPKKRPPTSPLARAIVKRHFEAPR